MAADKAEDKLAESDSADERLAERAADDALAAAVAELNALLLAEILAANELDCALITWSTTVMTFVPRPGRVSSMVKVTRPSTSVTGTVPEIEVPLTKTQLTVDGLTESRVRTSMEANR